jgi:cytochrome c-type biogenesis protein CcmH
MRARVPAAIAIVAVAIAAAAGAPAAAAAARRTTVGAIERQAMCVTCKIPLPEAQSPQATRERAFIRREVNAGYTETQIKQALVAEYGPSVLGLPRAHGFNLLVYVVPPVVVLLALVALAVALPRWRRRTRERHGEGDTDEFPAISPADVARLDQDLARFDL